MNKTAKKAAPTFDPRKTKAADQASAKKARRGGKSGTGPHTPKGESTGNDKPSPPQPIADLEEIKPPLPCHFLPKNRQYFTEIRPGEWSSVCAEDFQRELRAWGIGKRALDGKMVSDQDKVLRYVQRRCKIDAAMPLAGYKAGLREVNGMKLLVTVSPRTPVPKAGECPTIEAMFSQFCGVGTDPWGEEQYLVFTLWLARAFRQIDKGLPLPGHCLILAGPKAACKTMIQERIITAILGGRKAKAALVFVKDKDFTCDLAQAEHLYLADELVSSDYRTRMNLGEKMKSFVANRSHSVHPKGVDQMTLDPRWRITISLNDSPDRLAMLPPLDDEDISDKAILLKCHPVQRPTNDAESEMWIEHMLSELPAFLHRILQLEVPDAMKEEQGVRFGFKAFRNPGLLAEMADNESESTALAIIDKLLFSGADPQAVEGASHEVRSLLNEKSPVDQHLQGELKRLFPTESRVGQVLARIMARYPNRVEKLARSGNKRSWRIYPPPKMEHGDESDQDPF